MAIALLRKLNSFTGEDIKKISGRVEYCEALILNECEIGCLSI